MSKEKQYLNEMEQFLLHLAQEVNELDEGSPEFAEQLGALITKAIDYEAQKREECAVGARFSVMTTQLASLQSWHQSTCCDKSTDHCSITEKTQGLADDEMYIYIYLFNANGRNAISWRQLLASRALIDHSINRPIYAKENCVEELIRSKATPEQHAYVKAIVKKADVLMLEEESILRDKLGHPIIRIKHGALNVDNVIEFMHQGVAYGRKNKGDFDLERPLKG